MALIIKQRKRWYIEQKGSRFRLVSKEFPYKTMWHDDYRYTIGEYILSKEVGIKQIDE